MNMSYEGTCCNCTKKEVCKFMYKFQDLKTDLLKAPLGTDGYTMADETSNPFIVKLSCLHFSSNRISTHLWEDGQKELNGLSLVLCENNKEEL